MPRAHDHRALEISLAEWAAAVRARIVEFICRGDKWVFYAAVNITRPRNRTERGYLRINAWDNTLRKFNDAEWFVPARRIALDGGWQSVQMLIPDLTRATFSTEGWECRELGRIRLRGTVTLASIAIYA